MNVMEIMGPDLSKIIDVAKASMKYIPNVYNVQGYGAKGDGVKDDTSYIQSAINDAGAAGGGIVFIPIGQYRTTSTLNVSSRNVMIIGAGSGSRIIGSFADGHIFKIGRDSLTSAGVENFVMRDLRISSSVVKTSGAAVYCIHAERYEFYNIKASAAEDSTNLYDGFLFQYFDNCIMSRINIKCRHYGLTCYGKADQSWGSNLFLGNGSRITTDTISGSRGVYIGGSCGGVAIADTDIIGNYDGVIIDKALSGSGNREVFFNPGTYIDSSGNNGVQIGAGSGGLIQFNNTWIASSGQSVRTGIPNGNNLNTDPDNTGLNVIVDGCRIFNALGSGIVANAGEWSITDCHIHSNGQGTAGGDGVNIESPNVDYFTITGNKIKNNGNATRGIGIRVASGADQYVITGNIIRDNGTNDIVDSGGPNKVVANNLSA